VQIRADRGILQAWRGRGGALTQEVVMGKWKLVIGNKNYSSWSMRAWVLLRHAGIPFDEVQIRLQQPDTRTQALQHSPTGKVPCLLDGELRVWDSLAIAEYAAEAYPDRGLWPTDRQARAVARSVAAEMHSGFQGLRTHMPMNTRARYPGRGRGPGVAEDIERIQAIWRDCRQRFGAGGDYLFGDFCSADAFYAPVVTRFQTYAVELDAVCRSYSDAVLAVPAVQEWLQAGRDEPWTIPLYEQPAA
jgi:glutathione S-transferase